MTDLSKQGWKSVYPRGLEERDRGPGSTLPFSRSHPPALQFLRAKSAEISFIHSFILTNQFNQICQQVLSCQYFDLILFFAGYIYQRDLTDPISNWILIIF